MTSNDVIVLDSIFEQKKRQMASSLSDSEYFEIFTFEQSLKNYDLSYDQLLSGKIGGADDGGIDGFFFFINGELIEDDDLGEFKKNPLLELYLIQAKRETSFSEKAFDRVIATTSDIFDLTKDMAKLKSFYNSDLIDKATLFRETYLKLASLHPELKIYYKYASKGDVNEIDSKVKNRAEILNKTNAKYFTGSASTIEFWGARELLDASRIEKSYTLQLNFLENYLSRGVNNYIVISSLIDYYNFVTDENKNLRRYIFESNVRDYQGNVEVNKDIQNTLISNDELDFWWLNNGITILASKASIAGKTITLDNVQVVNGLQTTTIIYNYIRAKTVEEKDRKRSILVRIIVINDAKMQDRIIKATNFQTAIPIASLRATDGIHRDIEAYFSNHGWFYDRRKNYYKNVGKPIDKIISIPYLSQSVMAIILREPDNARARPSSLLKRDADYMRVFDESTNPKIYIFCAKTIKTVDSFLRGYSPPEAVRILKYHVAMVLVIKLLGKKDYKPSEVLSLFDTSLSDELLIESLDKVVSLAKSFGGRIENITKSREFVNYLLKNI